MKERTTGIKHYNEKSDSKWSAWLNVMVKMIAFIFAYYMSCSRSSKAKGWNTIPRLSLENGLQVAEITLERCALFDGHPKAAPRSPHNLPGNRTHGPPLRGSADWWWRHRSPAGRFLMMVSWLSFINRFTESTCSSVILLFRRRIFSIWGSKGECQTKVRGKTSNGNRKR